MGRLLAEKTLSEAGGAGRFIDYDLSMDIEALAYGSLDPIM